MADKKIFTLHVEGFTPETMPVARLADYLKDVSGIIGANAHLIGITQGSTNLALALDDETEMQARDRAADPNLESDDKFIAFNTKLRRDNAFAVLLDDKHGKVIEFP